MYNYIMPTAGRLPCGLCVASSASRGGLGPHIRRNVVSCLYHRQFCFECGRHGLPLDWGRRDAAKESAACKQGLASARRKANSLLLVWAWPDVRRVEHALIRAGRGSSRLISTRRSRPFKDRR